MMTQRYLRTAWLATLATVALLAGAAQLAAQSSSLFKAARTAPAPVTNERGEQVVAVSSAPVAANVSLISVAKPEPRKFQVNDIVTIVVSEASTSKSSADAKTDKKGFDVLAEVRQWLEFQDGAIQQNQPIADTPLKVEAAMQRKYEATGNANRSDTFVTRISAIVIDVKPNGNMVLEAKRFIKSDDEEITLALTGTVRPGDILLDNTVNSSSVAELTVTKSTRGISRDGQARGWLPRLLDLINPF